MTLTAKQRAQAATKALHVTNDGESPGRLHTIIRAVKSTDATGTHCASAKDVQDYLESLGGMVGRRSLVKGTRPAWVVTFSPGAIARLRFDAGRES